MPVTAYKGPLNVYGKFVPAGPASGLGVAQDYNLETSPSLFDQGVGIQDPRPQYRYQPGSANGTAQGTKGAYGWYGTTGIAIIDQVPSTLTTTAIAAAQAPTAGTPLTLVSSSGAGITVGVSIARADTGVTVNNLLAIDGAMGTVQNGFSGGNLMWDPTKAIARAVSIASVGNDSAATFTVRGFDVYNFPMTETITGANAGTATGNKAFKYILSITPAGTLSGSNVSAGQSDTIGFMLRADRFQYLRIFWPDTTGITSSTGFTAAVTTNPATATTGDVRGTYALQGSASNNSRRLQIFVTPSLANIGSVSGLVGVTQFADF
jgi:hypothetical protein